MIGDFLKKIRAIYGYKANELSVTLGISPSYLSEIENNKKQPSLELLQKCSQVYGIKLSSLILLSEKYDEAQNKNKSNAFIRNLMIHVIDGLSNGVEDTNEKKTKKI